MENKNPSDLSTDFGKVLNELMLNTLLNRASLETLLVTHAAILPEIRKEDIDETL